MSDPIIDLVRDRYAAVAASDRHRTGTRAVAEAFGYTSEDLARLPAEANLGLSCGNPTAFASLREGEVVVDLGCGGGLDVLLASEKVGPAGRAIGMDMTPEMIDRARAAARRVETHNVEFHLAQIDQLPLPAGSVDCILSNCVINLAPDKRAVFREMFRVLKPGGRVAVSDIALRKPLPGELARDVLAYVGCIAGAISIAEYEEGLRQSGFHDVQVVPTGADLNAYTQVEGQAACCPPKAHTARSASEGKQPPGPSLPIATNGPCASPATVHDALTDLASRYDLNEYAASVQVYALK
jgi:SAM-dependent methyltransferase